MGESEHTLPVAVPPATVCAGPRVPQSSHPTAIRHSPRVAACDCGDLQNASPPPNRSAPDSGGDHPIQVVTPGSKRRGPVQNPSCTRSAGPHRYFRLAALAFLSFLIFFSFLLFFSFLCFSAKGALFFSFLLFFSFSCFSAKGA